MKNVHVFVPVFLYAVTMLIFQIKRIISSEKWCNYIISFFFFENAKNLGRTDDGKQKKKEDGQNNVQRSVWRLFMSMVRSVIRKCYGVAEDSTEPFQSSPRPSYGKLIILIPF